MTGSRFLRHAARRLPWGHLSDDQLLRVAVSHDQEEPTSRAHRHLDACSGCEERLASVAAELDAVRNVAAAGFDEVFTPNRLQTQRARIAHRLATLVGTEAPARVLAFPFSTRRLPRLESRAIRWVGAATAAGLLLGVTAGQLVHFHPDAPDGRVAAPSETPATESARTFDMTGTVELPPLGDVNTEAVRPPEDPLTVSQFEQVLADEEFLGSLDLALTSFQVSELETIDALTPRVGDFSIDIR